MKICDALASDAEALCAVLEELVAAGKRTKASDADFACSHYINHPDKLRCSLALGDDGQLLGFQSLKLAKQGNIYGTPVRWGIIGTHVRPSAARQGVGKQLFAATREAALKARLPAIEAFIGNENREAIAYYESMGFVTYRHAEGAVCKSFKVIS
ncbi:MAG: GNAT family N-acetyltransferase [Brucellaceae bacterium]|nr:GNAT family N-acetyltransferase [Brucellaceae bacterium]